MHGQSIAKVQSQKVSKRRFGQPRRAEVNNETCLCSFNFRHAGYRLKPTKKGSFIELCIVTAFADEELCHCEP